MKQEQLANNLYDLIKVCFLSPKQQDAFAEMSREFSLDARNELYKWGKDKNIEVSGNVIKIGKKITITIN